METSLPETIGHYRIIDRIGVGEVGEVFSAYDNGLDRPVALKILHQSAMEDSGYLNRVRFKLEQVSQLFHPNLIRVFGLDEFEGRLMIIEEMIDGQTLSERLQFGCFDELSFYALATQIGQGLAYAHERRVIHGNLKPSNLILADDGYVKITDFGLEQRHDYVARYDPETEKEELRYLAPEQLTGEAAVANTDMFSLGAMFYEMLCGEPPFDGANGGELMNAILYNKPDWNRLRARGVHGDTVLLLQKMMSKDMNDRFANASEMLVSAEAIAIFEKNFTPSLPEQKRGASPRVYILLSTLMALLIIFWLVITTVYD